MFGPANEANKFTTIKQEGDGRLIHKTFCILLKSLESQNTNYAELVIKLDGVAGKPVFHAGVLIDNLAGTFGAFADVPLAEYLA